MAEQAKRIAPGTAAPARAASGNAEKARVLMSMIDGGGAMDHVPPERLRDWARDLVEAIEGDRPARPRSAPPRPAPRRLFTHPAPRLLVPFPAARQAHEAAGASPANGACDPAPGPRRATSIPATLPGAEIARLLEKGRHGNLGGEHPAVIAKLLADRPSRDQAAALRDLPGLQRRAVHRALRLQTARAA